MTESKKKKINFVVVVHTHPLPSDYPFRPRQPPFLAHPPEVNKNKNKKTTHLRDVDTTPFVCVYAKIRGSCRSCQPSDNHTNLFIWNIWTQRMSLWESKRKNKNRPPQPTHTHTHTHTMIFFFFCKLSPNKLICWLWRRGTSCMWLLCVCVVFAGFLCKRKNEPFVRR